MTHEAIERRTFIGIAAGAVGAGLTGSADAAAPASKPATRPATAPAALLDSPPVLQNPSPTAVTVVWAVSAPATGWVEYGPTPQLGRRADSAVYGLNPYDD